MLVEGWLARAASRQPGREALCAPGESWSYERLHDRARAGAAQLQAGGVGAGSRVGIALPAGLAFAQALHACLLLGAPAVPIDLRLAPAERRAIEDRCELVVGEPLASAASPAGGPAAPSTHDLDAVAAVLYTSGTSAAARPVELTYGNLLWSALGSAVALGSEEHDRWLCVLPLAHVGGLSIIVRSAIYATAAVVHERFETDRVLHALQRERVTLVSVVATTLDRLLEGGLRAPAQLRSALTGGGPVAPELLARAREAGVRVSLTYGLTEAASQVTTTPVAEAEPPPDRAGEPLFCARVRIASDGEILVRGATVAPRASAADGWLHTGDLGELDGRGRLRVHGRKGDTIISGGENVAPSEVEAVLAEHPDVHEAAVLGRPDERWGEAVTAIVVPRAGSAPSEEELRAHCAAVLAHFKVPKHFELSSAPLPRTVSGKLLRRSLR
jgi:O-succinylbenzoic acid--CoA ligase